MSALRILREDYLNLEFLSLFALEVFTCAAKTDEKVGGEKPVMCCKSLQPPSAILVLLPAEEARGQTASPPWREMEDWIRNKVKVSHFDQDTVGRGVSSVKHLLGTQS